MTTFYTGKKAILLGGLGFIGRHLAVRLLELGCVVTIIERNASRSSEKHRLYKELYEQCEIIDTDPVANPAALMSLLPSAQIVINLIHGDKNNLSTQMSFSSLDAAMLDYCKDRKLDVLFVHMGSRLEYSKNAPLPLREDAPLEPTTAYGMAKMISEQYFQHYSRMHGLKTLAFRTANVYGINAYIPGRKALIDGLIHSALAGAITINEDVTRYKDFIYIDDFVERVLSCISTPASYGKVFNVGSGEKISMMELAQLIKKMFNPTSALLINPVRDQSDFSFYLDTGKLENEIHPKPCIPLEEGLLRIKKLRGLA